MRLGSKIDDPRVGSQIRHKTILPAGRLRHETGFPRTSLLHFSTAVDFAPTHSSLKETPVRLADPAPHHPESSCQPASN